MRGSSTLNAGVSLASTITTAINQLPIGWLIFGVLIFEIRSLEYLNHIYPTDYMSCYPSGIWTYCWSSSGSNMVSSFI